MPGEEVQQVELAVGQSDLLPVALDPACSGIDLEVVEDDRLASVRGGVQPAAQGVDPFSSAGENGLQT